MKESKFGFKRVKIIALSVQDVDRANKFYGETLGLEEVIEDGQIFGWALGSNIFFFKPDWLAPTSNPNPRLTIEVEDSRATEAALKEAGVTISDPVEVYEESFRIGSFLDSEGNKLWFCSKIPG